ncbi:DUF1684 domain-containing protein [Pararhodonellum marinum]|uniref:DUF1684 domain-containing protein n=1 Tax=Pararhodonellum marinum TaxID=2755358 RepID=UPI001E646513|nr:DUF1684 domain-containing protein [Pararhodonellum marinum]
MNPEKYQNEVAAWHKDRLEFLKSPEGWLNLIGLAKLKEGPNRMGSGSDMDIQLIPGYPEYLGDVKVEVNQVFFEPAREGIKTSEGAEVVDKFLIYKEGGQALLSFGNLRWLPIKRGNQFFLRIRDLEAKSLMEFKEIERFPTELQWRWVVDFVPYEPVKEIPITNVLGQTIPNLSPGYLSFEHEGKSYKMDVIDEGLSEYLVIFADQTSGESTYGGGRYVYVPKPDRNGKTVLDFNKSYNPPCVFTDYATCPLPPKSHFLDFPILAGEKNYAY